MIALITAALAVQLSTRLATCPLGEGSAKVFERIGENHSGGYDSDLATYSSQGQWRTYALATCQSNLLTLLGSDFGMEIPASRKAAVEAALSKAVARLSNPGQPEIWERYSIAAAVYEALGRDPIFLGDLYLSASWTARDAVVGFYAALEGPEAARNLLDAGKQELAKDLPLEDRKKVLFNLARIAERGGWSSERDAWLNAFVSLGTTALEQQAIDRFRHIAGSVEPVLQEQAIQAYLRALNDKTLSTDQRTRLTYLVADLRRRQGRLSEAEAGFRKVPHGETQYAELAAYLLEHLHG